VNELCRVVKKGPSISPALRPCGGDIKKFFIIWSHYTVQRASGGAVGSGTELQAGRLRIRFSMVSLEFFVGLILPAVIWH
jgi:hypothetical protein